MRARRQRAYVLRAAAAAVAVAAAAAGVAAARAAAESRAPRAAAAAAAAEDWVGRANAAPTRLDTGLPRPPPPPPPPHASQSVACVGHCGDGGAAPAAAASDDAVALAHVAKALRAAPGGSRRLVRRRPDRLLAVRRGVAATERVALRLPQVRLREGAPASGGALHRAADGRGHPPTTPQGLWRVQEGGTGGGGGGGGGGARWWTTSATP